MKNIENKTKEEIADEITKNQEGIKYFERALVISLALYSTFSAGFTTYLTYFD